MEVNLQNGGPAPLWLILTDGREGGKTNLLIVELPGKGEVLPVFSFEEEARLYLWVEGLGDRWRVEATESKRLASVLSGACSRFEWVALDPMGERWVRGANQLVCMSGERFLSHLSRGPENTTISEGNGIEPVATGRRG